ncbi:MAG: amino acid ABC transporter substrate-binding protein [Desulfobacteraceae bacterium]|nr:amino acid ABC transporter substrate-binding protein [Desulfobacteraceae bacterium]
MYKLRVILQFFCVLIVLITPPDLVAEESIILGNGEWKPFHSKNLKHYGVASHIVTEAFALMKVKVKYKFFPWKRALLTAKEGKIDGVIPWARTPETIKYFILSEEVYAGRWVFFHLKKYPFAWETLEDLKGIKIGGVLGSLYGEEFIAAEKAGIIKVHRIPRDTQLFPMLLLERIQIFPQDLNVGYEMLQEDLKPGKIQLVTHHPKEMRPPTPYYLILSKKIKRNKRMIELFNKGLKQLENSGKITEFMEASRRGEYKKMK